MQNKKRLPELQESLDQSVPEYICVWHLDLLHSELPTCWVTGERVSPQVWKSLDKLAATGHGGGRNVNIAHAMKPPRNLCFLALC